MSSFSHHKTKDSTNVIYSLHDMMQSKVVAENMSRKPYINWAVKRVTRSLQVLWPRSRTNIFGSNATGMALPTSDVDLVVCLPPVRNLVLFSLFILLYFPCSYFSGITFFFFAFLQNGLGTYKRSWNT